MRRTACVDIKALPLQWLLRSHPDWRGFPAAVVAEDKPLGEILFVNEHARKSGILPGQKYATALALARELRASVVGAVDLNRCVDEMTSRLRRFTPDVEPSRETPGIFWLDAHGLSHLYPSLKPWAQGVRDECALAGFIATVVVGFTRFGSYAVARASRDVRVFETAREEEELMHRVPLTRVDFEPRLRDDLLKLGIRTLGNFLELPPSGLRERFGAQAEMLHRVASGERFSPLQPETLIEPLVRKEDLGYPDSDSERLLFICKRLLDSLIDDLKSRSHALVGLKLHLTLDDRSMRETEFRTAAPTLDAIQVLNLLRLRLGMLVLSSGVTGISLEAVGERASAHQIRLMIMRSRRDRDALARAFARLRAEMGEETVVRAVVKDAHLPRASFEWQPLLRLNPDGPRPRRSSTRPLVRRVRDQPMALPPRPRSEPDGWLLRGIEHGRVERFAGPYVVSGAWWRGEGVHRDYYFAEMTRGDVLWVYFDRRRQQWFLEGRIE